MRIARENQSLSIGKKAEDLFKSVCQKAGYTVIPSSEKENMYDHVDFLVNTDRGYFSVDVKGNCNTDCIWVELRNVQGKAGWLYGGADYIAFNITDCDAFAVVGREELEARCMEIIKPRFVGYDDAKYNLYTRIGRYDVISRIVLQDIVSLKTFRLMQY